MIMALRMFRMRAISTKFCTTRNPTSYRRRYATAVASQPPIYDVVCVGGGPAGLGLLTALRSSPITSHLSLALVESQSLSSTRSWSPSDDGYTNRVSSLTPASSAFLHETGVSKRVDASRTAPYQRMHVWDASSSSSKITFDAPSSNDAIAIMTENANLTKGLLSHLESLPDISIYDGIKVESIIHPEAPPAEHPMDLSSYPHIQLSSGDSMAARLLVGADGPNSPVRRFAGINSRGWDYQQHGVVATLRLDPKNYDHNGPKTAYQRFLPTGPIAILPLPGPFATLVWSTSTAKAQALKSLALPDFTALINGALRLSPVDIEYMTSQASGQIPELAWRQPIMERSSRLPIPTIPCIDSIQEGTVASFPLRYRQADSYVSSRVALIGDAAHTVHPLAGQGLNMALSDVKSLAKQITYGVEHGMDIGDLGLLNRYNAETWMANNRMLGAVDKIGKLYSVGSGPVVWARGVGLNAVDQMEGLKSWFMGQAGGKSQAKGMEFEGIMQAAAGLTSAMQTMAKQRAARWLT